MYVCLCVCVRTHAHTLHKCLDVSPGIGMRHLEGPKNPYELNLGIHIVTRHCMKGGSRRILGGDSGKRTPSTDLWRVLNGSFVQPFCRVSPCTFWMLMTRTAPLPLPHSFTFGSAIGLRVVKHSASVRISGEYRKQASELRGRLERVASE